MNEYLIEIREVIFFPYNNVGNTNIIEVEMSNSLQLLTMFSVLKIIDFNNSIITLWFRNAQKQLILHLYQTISNIRYCVKTIFKI